ncbi:uncharacterized protein BDV14DRAFT_199018 [Aspergillus stella-maris]|uniref:uncharacterized protein n=1 Tax=Aspergillus stella-maris TaxID=1810926 RepID=UPI003CCC9FBB
MQWPPVIDTFQEDTIPLAKTALYSLFVALLSPNPTAASAQELIPGLEDILSTLDYQTGAILAYSVLEFEGVVHSIIKTPDSVPLCTALMDSFHNNRQQLVASRVVPHYSKPMPLHLAKLPHLCRHCPEWQEEAEFCITVMAAEITRITSEMDRSNRLLSRFLHDEDAVTKQLNQISMQIVTMKEFDRPGLKDIILRDLHRKRSSLEEAVNSFSTEEAYKSFSLEKAVRSFILRQYTFSVLENIKGQVESMIQRDWEGYTLQA